MARQGIESNPKFLRLAAGLHAFSQGMGEALARGLLEQLWDAAYTAADDNVGEAEDIEARVRWRGPAGALATLLAAHVCGKVGFIEPDEERGGYKLHDFWEHAPPWVKRKAENDAKRKAAGVTISDLRREAGKRKHGADPTNGQQKIDYLQTACCDLDGKRSGREGKGREGKVEDQTPLPPKGGVGRVSLDFEPAYAAYPRKEGKHRGIETLRKTIHTQAELDDFVLAVANYTHYCRVNEVEPKYVKHFSTFVNNWRDYAPTDEDREQAALARRAAERFAAAAAKAEDEPGAGFELPRPGVAS